MSSEVTLKTCRLDKGLSIRAAAKAAGVTADILLRAEGGSTPRPRHAKRIADFYGYKVTDIWPVEKETV